jgi:hypothetical protein
MIHHISIAANHPLHVAQVLAEIFAGQAAPFPEHPGSYIALLLDPHGTLIEVHPRGTELRPGTITEPCQAVQNSNASSYTATHAAISVPTSENQIRLIAEREGWHVARFDRAGCFEVIELWIENQQLIELLPSELAAKYVAFMHPKNLQQFLTAQSN